MASSFQLMFFQNKLNNIQQADSNIYPLVLFLILINGKMGWHFTANPYIDFADLFCLIYCTINEVFTLHQSGKSTVLLIVK